MLAEAGRQDIENIGSVPYISEKKEIPEGKIFNIHIPEGIPFRGFGDMIMKMDRIYDLLDYPQAELKIREWDDREKWTGTLLESGERWHFGKDAVERYQTLYTGKAPFVYVETRFRRYGGWQGILQEGRKKLTYRSTLEFLSCMMGYVKEMPPLASIHKNPCEKNTL